MTVPEKLLLGTDGFLLPPQVPARAVTPPQEPTSPLGPAPCPAQRRPGGAGRRAPIPPNAGPPRGTTRCPPRRAAPRAGPGQGRPRRGGLPGGWRRIRQAPPTSATHPARAQAGKERARHSGSEEPFRDARGGRLRLRREGLGQAAARMRGRPGGGGARLAVPVSGGAELGYCCRFPVRGRWPCREQPRALPPRPLVGRRVASGAGCSRRPEAGVGNWSEGPAAPGPPPAGGLSVRPAALRGSAPSKRDALFGAAAPAAEAEGPWSGEEEAEGGPHCSLQLPEKRL